MPKTKTEDKKSEKKINIKPLMGYILVEPSEAESKTASGLYLPETAQEKPAQGKVVAVGDDFFLPNGQVLRAPVSVGQKVIYKKWGGDEIKVSGIEYKLVKFEDLMAVIED
ncbi:MAG: 10 kDa chaperonin [Candidatus Daviesbacteria bacterium GW2011_GWA1_36_8]|uniref:Co-chaperonin GroES n=2 Tax=Candidatus Daviesiibacteriota TaxID=1752718 RepID=A0A0G0ET17_9BACT|nr:MAG: 10 kDa chaperonin [Candidatus Daviesbacteria bacterium GW2011_GWB1_36_5]KKQ15930.1 MAG: 10 kDa chaperonin [Candidatus Daviesbacteria bacterium GW2011_GWA1_36_8]